ncbi:hypothetical protein C8046_02970 [Serinibacter arcticus]|uniref:Glycoside phosphorylase C-terminal domain-containing protein n=1 Tax=Serinibacter arcticus TaxID=1655435 RepID=A0A2U1ZS84_9MICO|nr:hypothetical protein [Serinibacter arcticus]PWD49810.1 hypothetical protein C8046_02970 [Serinibacter arcticus]
MPDRYAALRDWDAVRAGEVEVEGGWRIYSSGPGIALRIVVESVLGVVRRADALVLDPVLVPGLDGLRVTVPLWGRRVAIVYRVGSRGYGPRTASVDGVALATTREHNPYREGGLRIARAELLERLDGGGAIEVEVP